MHYISKTITNIRNFGICQTFLQIRNFCKKRHNRFRGQEVISPCEKSSLSECEKLHFPKFNAPIKVSIIIPVYNQFSFTYHCLKSILETTHEYTYEIIVADDCSTDLTSELEKITENIVIQHNTTNLRFLLNCNAATRIAQGEFIIFLNNDTIVHPNWLATLVQTIERDPQIGLVGSKLVFANGALQEAGGIIWQNGIGANYGREFDPSAPEYNYTKEVDYISGASIIIRKRLWDSLGGFDETFAPAYFEDADLAFAVRKLGYKVIYQPLSVITHFEGISNGTDCSGGQKKYQVINRSKFVEKWGEELLAEHLPYLRDEFLARDRSKHKKHLLIIIVDKKEIVEISGVLNFLLQSNWQITCFLPEDKNSTTLQSLWQQQGVEVRIGATRKQQHQWIRNHQKYLQGIYTGNKTLRLPVRAQKIVAERIADFYSPF